MERIWLSQYSEGVPKDITEFPFTDLVSLIENKFEKFADKPCIECAGRVFTFAEIDKLTRDFAAFLQQKSGLKKGDHIALMSPNLPSQPAAARPEDLGGAKWFHEAVQEGAELDFTRVDVGPDDLAFLQYTGGTTGLSKGAMLSHLNVAANIHQCELWLAPKIVEGEELIVTALPLYHIFALVINLFIYFNAGGCNLLIPNPRDIEAFVGALQGKQFTAFTGVNTLYNGLQHVPPFRELDFSQLRMCLGGGTAVQAAVAEGWRQLTGCMIHEGYGLSVTSPVLTVNPMTNTEFTATIGVPVPATDMALLDDDGNEVPMGERGEICARGPQVMKGYYNKPDATAEVMTADGYFKTGDIAIVDERGYFTIVDRKKDMILVSGFNVYPNEIEAVLAGHDDIVEAACVGVPDDITGEAVKVFVVRKPDATLDEAGVEAYCRDNLTAYKVPKQVAFIDELPKSAVGKILRRELRDT